MRFDKVIPKIKGCTFFCSTMYNVTVNMFHVIRDIETVVLYVAAVIWG